MAGIDNGIKPLNAAALQYVDQVGCPFCLHGILSAMGIL